MRCIADITALDFKQVCHAGIGKAWESIIYSMIQSGECQIPATVGLEKRKYSGALVLEPEPKGIVGPSVPTNLKSEKCPGMNCTV